MSGKWCVAIAFDKPPAQTNYLFALLQYPRDKTTSNKSLPQGYEGLYLSKGLPGGGWKQVELNHALFNKVYESTHN